MHNRLPKKTHVFLLLSLCLVLVALLTYFKFSLGSFLNKGFSPAPLRVKKGTGEELIPGEYCSQLLNVFREMESKAIAKAKQGTQEAEQKTEGITMDYNSIVDINQDGKTDLADRLLIMKNIENDDWCKERIVK